MASLFDRVSNPEAGFLGKIDAAADVLLTPARGFGFGRSFTVLKANGVNALVPEQEHISTAMKVVSAALSPIAFVAGLAALAVKQVLHQWHIVLIII